MRTRLSNASMSVASNFEALHIRDTFAQVEAHAPLVAHLRNSAPMFGIYAVTITEERLKAQLIKMPAMKNSPEEKHFGRFEEEAGRPLVGRCELIKYVACRNGNGNYFSCAVKKRVTCIEVCDSDNINGNNLNGNNNINGNNINVEIHGNNNNGNNNGPPAKCRRDLCFGKYGHYACAHVAMVA